MIARLLAAAIIAMPLLAAAGERAPGLGANAAENGFNAFIESLWPVAERAGIRREVFHDALRGLTPDAEVLALTKRQPEYNLSAGAYLNRAVNAARIAKGRELAQKWSPVLDRIEAQFGVDRFVVLALWGLETGYGAAPGNKDALRSLLTLAYARYRDDFFRDELIQALLILQSEKISRSMLSGSWAGAMGQPQFLPSSFRKYAVDFDGDGRRDIWRSVPDTLASIANYLKLNGWTTAASWGFAVNLPDQYDLRVSRGSFPDWQERGVTNSRGVPLPASGDAVLYHPSGYPGPAFLVTHNFDVVKTYNNSDAYALSVGLLASALKGESPPAMAWPNRIPLSRGDRIELQRQLARLGYAVSNFNGWMDFDLRDIVRKIQYENAMTPDGEPAKELLAIVRRQASSKEAPASTSAGRK